MNNQTIFMSNLKGRIIQVLRKVKKGLPKYLVKYSSDYKIIISPYFTVMGFWGTEAVEKQRKVLACQLLRQLPN